MPSAPRWSDRFGPLPAEVEHLLATVVVKALCRRANVAKIEAGPKGAVLSFRDDRFANPEGLSPSSASRAATPGCGRT